MRVFRRARSSSGPFGIGEAVISSVATLFKGESLMVCAGRSSGVLCRDPPWIDPFRSAAKSASALERPAAGLAAVIWLACWPLARNRFASACSSFQPMAPFLSINGRNSQNVSP